MLYIIGSGGDEIFTRGFSMLFVITGIVLIFFGKSLFALVSFSVFYLILMIPLPYFIYNEIAVPLKLLAAKVATNMLQFMT